MSRAYPQPNYTDFTIPTAAASNPQDIQFFGGNTTTTNYNNVSSTSSSSASASASSGYPSSFTGAYNDISGSMSNNPYNSSSNTMTSSSSSSSSGSGYVDYDNEAPLLEELGIDFKLIIQRTLAVSIPFKKVPALHENADADLAGPLIFALALGTALLFTGKVQYGYIYGFGLLGSVGMYTVINLMSHENSQENQWPVSFDRTISILGYSLLPIVLLAVVSIFVDLQGYVGLIAGITSIAWSTITATRMFEAALDMREQRYLIAYPATMLYACFTLLTIF